MTVSGSGVGHLFEAIKPGLKSMLGQFDFAGGICAGAVFALLAWKEPAAALRIGSVGASFMGIALGAVIGGLSIQAAYLDTNFLRKLRTIEESKVLPAGEADPVRLLRPNLITAVLGVLAVLALLVLSGCSVSTPLWFLAPIAAVAGLLMVWTLLSVIACLGMLVQFVNLRNDSVS